MGRRATADPCTGSTFPLSSSTDVFLPPGGMQEHHVNKEWRRVQRAPAEKQPLILTRATYLDTQKTSLKGKGFCYQGKQEEQNCCQI